MSASNDVRESLEPSPLRVLEKNPILRKLREPWELLCKYFRTRRAVLSGASLYDVSEEELKARDLQGPWTFNLTQSTLAAAPTLLLLKVLNFWRPYTPPVPQGLSPLGRQTVEYFPSVLGFFSPFLVPLSLMLLASVVAFGSLHRKDATRERTSRAKYAYLYFDGALGLIPQFTITLVIALTTWVSVRGMWSPPIGWALGGLGLYGWGYTIYQKFHKEPLLLFTANGYSTVPVHFWTPHHKRPPNVAPWSRYTVAVMILGGILAWTLVIVFWMLSYGIAIALAAVKLKAA